MRCVAKMQLLFVFVERDNEEVGEPVANYFGITGQETTVMTCVLCYLYLYCCFLHRNWMLQFSLHLMCLCYFFVCPYDCRFLLTLGMKMLGNFSLMVKYR